MITRRPACLPALANDRASASVLGHVAVPEASNIGGADLGRTIGKAMGRRASPVRAFP